MCKVTKPRKTKVAKLSPRARELAPQFIAEEHGRFPHRTAVAVGISRARRQAESERVHSIIKKYE